METERIDEKKSLRKRTLILRDALSVKERQKKSEQITRTLQNTEWYQQCKQLFCYVSFRSEVDTRMLITQAFKDGKTVACPRVLSNGIMTFHEIHNWSDCEPGHYGIPEPKQICQELQPLAEHALILVPGSCFDKECNRIGYGGGYYDRYLEKYGLRTVGLFFDCQEADVIPCNKYDQKLHMIVTESGIRYKQSRL